ncbi:MAG: macro domain-containing protein, partial [Clostridia bacterium]|nr:macro domain-containing protein [Clostridia bacterium]
MPLQIVRMDISTMQVDAIVNPTNEGLVGYSGVDLAVHRGAGPRLDAACAKLAPLRLGDAKVTKGYNLKAKYIIHTVGPVWQGGSSGESEILRSCYWKSLQLAVKKHCSSVAFPLISSGRYGFPKDQVLRFAV